MSRFRLPPRVAPSPAAGEPGLQYAAARLRSSREAQARILKERRGDDASGEEAVSACEVHADLPGGPTVTPPTETSSQAVGRISISDAPSGALLPPKKTPRKEKLVVLFRLPLVTAAKLAAIKGTAELGEAYVLKALAKEGRVVLRTLRGASDLRPWTPTAADVRATSPTHMSIGESMTVYLQPNVLSAMHEALGDPWKVLPKATAAGAYLAAIVTHLVEARLAR